MVYIKIIFYKITSPINYQICFYLAISIAVTILFPPERLLFYLCLPLGYDGLAVLDVVAVFLVPCHDSVFGWLALFLVIFLAGEQI